MGASRSIDVTGANKNSGTATAGGTFTHFRIYAADGTTPKSNWAALTTPQTIGAGGMLNVADAGIKVQLGVTGSTTVGQLSDATLIIMLDAASGLVGGAVGTCDVLKFATSSAGANSTDIAAIEGSNGYPVNAWAAAVAF